jgi:excinuclease UvrABC nuclease subunit
MQEKQIISDTSGANTDTIGATLLSGHAFVTILRERGGKLVGEESFSLQGTAETLPEVLAQFLPQYYVASADLPDTVVVGEEPDDRATLEKWLSDVRGKKLALSVPHRGKKSKLLALAEKNAEEKARLHEATWEAETRKVDGALRELAALLCLGAPPRRIEGYDISHLGGTATVGSMVVVVGGKPKREHYRSFNIRSVAHGDVDDYKSIAETLRRRLKYLAWDLKREERDLKASGISFGKARKAEEKTILSLIKKEGTKLSSEDIHAKDFLVGRREKEIVALGRLLVHAKVEVEMKTVWVRSDYRGKGLASFIVRKLLAQAKKKWKKVYVRIDPAMEEFYAELGFRIAKTLPPVLEKKIQEHRKRDPGVCGTTMVYLFAEHKDDDSFRSIPDLILIDGGKGQLSAAVEVLKHFKLNIPVAGLAKREEEIFVPSSPVSLTVPRDSEARFLLQRLRDEAHRFANVKRERRLETALFERNDQ